MSLKEVTITGPNNVKAKVTGQEELLVRLNSIAPNTIATEATLQAVLNTLQAFTEYEAKFVIDANNEIFLEVRVWNEDTSTWASAPTYYRVGENTPASPAPVAPISYLDASSVLQSITYAEDSPHVSGDKGVFALTVRNDANAAMTSANGDYSPIAVNNKGAVAIQDGGNSITVDSVNLDIRDLTHLADTVKIYGSNNANPVATDIAGNIGIQDGGNSITVDAIDLDIRQLDCGDKVSVCFNDGVNDITVSTANPLPTTASVTFPSSLPVTQDAASDPWTVDGTVDTNLYAEDAGTGTPAPLTYTGTGTANALDVNQVSYARIPNIIISSGNASFTVAVDVYSITFFNNGSTTVNVSMDGGATNAGIPAGVTITMDAGGINNTYAANTFVIGSTVAAGASMIITYNS